MSIVCLRVLSPVQVIAAAEACPPRYVLDWTKWLECAAAERTMLFGRILRKWQATRPHAMRRLRAEAPHPAPYLDDLVAAAEPQLRRLGCISVRDLPDARPATEEAMCSLWHLFRGLPSTGIASCVGISKAVLLLTDGRIGPAFDSQVRRRVLGRAGHLKSAEDWVYALRQVGEDIRAFEAKHRRRLADAVPPRFAGLECGRLYDMIFGPR